MKGLILAGGSGTRLFPLTKVISKQLLPVYDKPMIYYPLSILLLAGIKEVLIITTPESNGMFIKTLGDGSQWGVKIIYKIQMEPNGIPEAFIIAKDFIKDDRVCFILGDNLFYGQGFSKMLQNSVCLQVGATVYAYKVLDPERYGVVEFDESGKVISIEEKPVIPKSNFALTGLYFYDNNVINIAKTVQHSARGELEISSINEMYLKADKLKVEVMGRGFAWLDTGTHESMLEASQFVHTIEKRQGFKIACLEEIGWRNSWITDEELSRQAERLSKSNYGYYLNQILENS